MFCARQFESACWRRWISPRSPSSGKRWNRRWRTSAANCSSLSATTRPTRRWPWSPSRPATSKPKTSTANRVSFLSIQTFPFRLDWTECFFLFQIPTSKCGCTLGTSEWRSARRPSTSAPWSRCLTRRSPSTCRGRRSANARSTSASWTLTTSAVMSSSDAFHSPVSYWVLIHSALWPPPTHQKFIAGPENSMIDAPTLWVCARGSIGMAPIQ